MALVVDAKGPRDRLRARVPWIRELETAPDSHAPPWARRLRGPRTFAASMGVRFSRRAVLLALVFGVVAILGMAAFAALLTGVYEILALAPLSIILWVVLFVWVAARVTRMAERRREG